MTAVEDLYAVLGVAQTATLEEVRKAYYKSAMKFHPDKFAGKPDQELETAKTKFQQIGLAYSVLSDERKRMRYDKTGSIDDDLNHVVDWSDYLDSLYKRVSAELIEEFSQGYKNSEEEKRDLFELYNTHCGKMNEIIDHLMLGHDDEEPRYREIIRRGIEAGELEEHRAFVHRDKGTAAQRRRRVKEEAKEAGRLARQLGVGTSTDLALAIQKRQLERDDIASRLMAKYGGKQADNEIGDEEFEALQIKMKKRREKEIVAPPEPSGRKERKRERRNK